MSSSYVCQTCRRELRRRLLQRRAPQWQSRATFISFNEIVPPLKEQEPPAEDVDADTAFARSFKRLNRKDGKDALIEDVVDETKPSPGRYSRFGGAKRDALRTSDFKINTDNLRSLDTSRLSRGLESLSVHEAETLNPRPSQDEPEPDILIPTPAAARRNVQAEDGPAAQLWNALSSKDADAVEAWGLFNRHYLEPGKECDAIKRPSTRDRSIIRDKRLFRQLLRTVSTQWEPGNDALPPPAVVVQTLHEYGVMGHGWYLLEILELVYHTLRTSPTASIEQQETSGRKIILEEQILLLWSQFFRNCPSKWMAERGHALQNQEQKGKISWNGLPDIERLNFSKVIGGDAYRFPFRIHRMFNGVPVASTQHLAVAAMLSFDYFATQYCRAYATPDERIPYEPFLRLMLKTLHGAQDTDIVASLAVSLLEDNEVPAEEVKAVQQRLSHIQARAALAIAIDDPTVLGPTNVDLTEEQDNKLIGYFHGRIKRQIERQNRGVIDQLWQQAQLAYNSLSSPSEGEGQSNTLIPPKIYSAFLFGYRDLHDAERQTEIWNHMLAAGMTPTHEQWGLMLSARMKHLNSLEHIWERMQTSGTKPDHQTWCTRISAHVYYGHPEEGIALLYEWSNSWYKEVCKMFEDSKVDVPEMERLTRDGPTIPRPDTDTLTTIITALVQRKSGKGRRLDLVPDAFAWAQTFAVKPNLWTYNTLFRTCLKDGNLKEAMQILAKMEEDKITPDAFTFYGFADFIFKQANKSAMSADEQYRLMFNILDMLEQRGLEPSNVFFGSMINNLLKSGQDRGPNLPAAMLLLRVMLEKNVPVSSQIWTILMTHHFQQGRSEGGSGVPDWNAIEGLWKQMNQTTLGLDAMFYDRMIEGFASFGEINKAVNMLERMGKEGKRPGWSALGALLEAFVDQQLVDQARGLVRDVAAGTGLLREGVRSARDTTRNPARERFFEIAQHAGLTEDEGIDMVAVKEYRVGKQQGMGMPMGVEEGYTSFGSGSSIVERERREEEENRVRDLEDIERQFKEERQLMPGWDEVVERANNGKLGRMRQK